MRLCAGAAPTASLQLTLLLVLAHLHILATGFNLHSHFPDGVLRSHPSLFQQLSKYVRQHSRDAMLLELDSDLSLSSSTSIANSSNNNDSSSSSSRGQSLFCSRKFAVATYSAPEQIGNHMHEFLNAFVAAFVTNRTLLWEFCARKPCQKNSYRQCHDTLLPRFPWIMHVGEMTRLWSEQNCSESPSPFPLTKMWHRDYAEEIVMCCGLDNLTLPVVYYGTFEQHESYSLSLPNAKLSSESRHRAESLFKLGEFFGYGALLKSCFRFGTALVEENSQLIRNHINGLQTKLSSNNISSSLSTRSEHDYFFISLHIRHANTAPASHPHQDERGLSCLRKMIEQYSHYLAGRPCIVLLSTDRLETWEHFSALSPHELGNCSIMSSNRDGTHVQKSEHGPYTGVIAVRDIELLSRGDIFIGSTYNIQKLSLFTSTFSLLIAELRSMNGRNYSLEIPPVFSSTCDSVVASRTSPKNIFISNRTCDAKDMNGIPFPAECIR